MMRPLVLQLTHLYNVDSGYAILSFGTFLFIYHVTQRLRVLQKSSRATVQWEEKKNVQ